MAVQGSSFIVDYDTAKTRLSLRVYFTVIFVILAAVCDRCSNLRSTLRILHGKVVKLPLTTGWLDGIAAIKAWIVQRSLPGGWLGIIMILAWILSVGSDWMVSSLVKTTMIVGRCEFGKGVICNPANNTMLNTPDRENPAVTVVQQAQNYSITNGGLSGIFRKANGDQYFRADSEDLLGTWECKFTGNDTYSNTTSIPDVVADLESKGRIYGNGSLTASYGISPNGWNSLSVWSASQPDDALESFNVRVSRDVTANEDFRNRTISSFFCTMDAAEEIGWILQQLQPNSTLNQWNLMLHAQTGQCNETGVSEAIVSLLNLITMVGSEGWISSSKEPLTTGTLDTTQGCLMPRAEIPAPVLFVLAVVTFGVVGFFVYWRILQAQLHPFRRARYQQRDRIEHFHEAAPNGLMDCMAFVAQQFHTTEHVGVRDLSKFVLVKDGEGDLKVALHEDLVADNQICRLDERMQPIQSPPKEYREGLDGRIKSPNIVYENPPMMPFTHTAGMRNLGIPHRKPVGSSGT
jgi:hypothetical protein